jgi:hypothetical protein
MEGIEIVVASIASLIFWACVSIITVVILTTRSSTTGIPIDLTPKFVSPGTLAQKSSCRSGVESACASASSLGERLACQHKKLVDCYASKRIPDDNEEPYVTPGGRKDRCIGMVAHGTNGPFSNRTTFPVCLDLNQVVTFPKGHPYKYVARDVSRPTRNYALTLPNKYIQPSQKRVVDGKTEYLLGSGNPLPYGLNERLVRLREEYGYDVLPVYERDSNGVLQQIDLSSIPVTITRRQ